MPSLRPQQIEPPPCAGAADWGGSRRAVLAAKHYLCLFNHLDEIAAMAPDMSIPRSLDLPGVIVTAPATDDVDFVSRFFAPANGVPEDPVSGVAHLCLAPYWAERLGKRKLIGRQLSARGGLVRCEDLGATRPAGGKTQWSFWRGRNRFETAQLFHVKHRTA